MSDIATVLESLCREIEASSAQVAEAHKTIRQLSKPKKIKPNAKK
jgi:cell division protein FtsL